MKEYEEYEKAEKAIEAVNNSYLETFSRWLESSGISSKTIRHHVNNVDFYINYYLTYYEADAQWLKSGCYSIDGYLGDFFIRKALWSSSMAIKASASSIKKFYKCMLEHELVTQEDYANLQNDIKTGMSDWLTTMRRSEEAMLEIDMFDDLLD